MLRAPAKERCWLQRLLLRPNGIKLKNLIRLEGRTMPEVAVEDLHTLALFHHVHSFSDSMFTCLHTGCIVVFLGISFAWGGSQSFRSAMSLPCSLVRPERSQYHQASTWGPKDPWIKQLVSWCHDPQPYVLIYIHYIYIYYIIYYIYYIYMYYNIYIY